MGTAADAAYQSRLSGEQTIAKLAFAGFNGVNTLMGIIGAAESAAAMSASGASLATRWSVYTLPISAFFLGAGIRESIDDEKEKRHQARVIILSAGFRNAVENHGKRYPNSKILDSSTVTGIKILSDPKYHMVTIVFRGLHKKWWGNLPDAIDEWRATQVLSGPFLPKKQTWEQFVRGQFNQITREYGNLLFMAETVR